MAKTKKDAQTATIGNTVLADVKIIYSKDDMKNAMLFGMGVICGTHNVQKIADEKVDEAFETFIGVFDASK
jgi:valyl-tRNA synthetase